MKKLFWPMGMVSVKALLERSLVCHEKAGNRIFAIHNVRERYLVGSYYGSLEFASPEWSTGYRKDKKKSTERARSGRLAGACRTRVMLLLTARDRDTLCGWFRLPSVRWSTSFTRSVCYNTRKA